MAKIPFDIKYRPQIESGEYKVETRNGLPVRIICWDRKHGYPIVGLAYEKVTKCESYVSAYADGTTSINGKMELSDDLFIITPEPELSEDEIAWLKSLRPRQKQGGVWITKEQFEQIKSASYLTGKLDHWKPSENQMSMLLAIVNDPNNAGAESCHLAMQSLYDDLKKLM